MKLEYIIQIRRLAHVAWLGADVSQTHADFTTAIAGCLVKTSLQKVSCIVLITKTALESAGWKLDVAGGCIIEIATHNVFPQLRDVLYSIALGGDSFNMILRVARCHLL